MYQAAERDWYETESDHMAASIILPNSLRVRQLIFTSQVGLLERRESGQYLSVSATFNPISFFPGICLFSCSTWNSNISNLKMQYRRARISIQIV